MKKEREGLKFPFKYKKLRIKAGGHGATVARLIPDQKVGCSNHSVLTFFFKSGFFYSLFGGK